MLLVSWNVNGVRACLGKGLDKFFDSIKPDIFCMQEIKARQEQVNWDPLEYHTYWHSAQKAGYSGTAVFSKEKALNVMYDMEGHNGEGRILTLEYPDFYLVNTYTPNSQHELLRLDFRMEWQDYFVSHLKMLDAQKPVVICGDLNVAHQEIDIKNAKSNHNNPGFTDKERQKMSELLEAGFSDTYRERYPDKHDAYTWWSYMPGVRERNVGWRIDYFLTSKRLMPTVKDALIYADIYGSDHCPVGLVL